MTQLKVLRRCLNIASDGRLYQKLAPETGKTRLPTVERLNGGTASWLEEVNRSLCRDGTSVTRVKYDDRYMYTGALLLTARQVVTAILNTLLCIGADWRPVLTAVFDVASKRYERERL